MKLTDGKNVIELTMTVNGGEDWAPTFFAAATLPKRGDARKVEDFRSAIELAERWRDGLGDFAQDAWDEDRRLTIEWL